MENTTNKMNICQKLNEARYTLKQKTIKASGKNEYANYTYIQLDDFLPEVTKLEHTLGFMTVISFTKEQATATVINTDNPEDRLVFETPMSTAQLKGCHEVQNLGAVETYLRRYLYMVIYEIVEQDVLDKTAGEGQNAGGKPTEKKQATNPTRTKAEIEAEAKNTVMPTGKYKDQKLGDINTDYLDWYCKQSGGDQKLKTAMEIILRSSQKAEPKKEEPKPTSTTLTQEELDELPFTL